jgi:FlaA1/EpsC-like NDP-sugar epimerase
MRDTLFYARSDLEQHMGLVDRLVDQMLRLRNRHFLGLDVLLLLCTPALALALRLESWSAVLDFGPSLTVVTLAFLAVKLPVFTFSKLYRRFWRHASIDEMARIIFAVALAVLVQTLLFFGVLRPTGLIEAGFPRSVPFIEGLLALLVVGGVRFSVRLAQRVQQRFRISGRRVLVMGAGDAGVMIVDEMRSNPELGLWPVGFVDDDPSKQGLRVRGLDVLGTREDIPELGRSLRINLVVIAIPRATGKDIRAIAEICRDANLRTKTMPGVYEVLDGQVRLSQLRDIQMEDLLRREPVQSDMARVKDLLEGRRILVTGGGGSIGAELCRQIVELRPAEVVCLGHGENSIYRITRELRHRLKDMPHAPRVRPVIADIRDRPRLEQVFAGAPPEIVFHAAAHKHVPLMEANLHDAVTNNIDGTRHLLALAEAHDVEQFILVSTDKAVNPTSIMGVTKRAAERLVCAAARRTGRAFMAVRFGNVLGSRGSVLHVFKDQIERGGPITVTHPKIERYFMTIPEAVHLVLEAAALGRGSEVFLLDMGEPVRIVDLARDLLRLYGKEEGRDIDIVFMGLRPGEKLYEELSRDGEALAPTDHPKIRVCRPHDETGGALDEQVDALLAAVQDGSEARARTVLKGLVPEYAPPDTAQEAPTTMGDGETSEAPTSPDALRPAP